MESIFENLENLNVSEECFNDIMNIVEEIINEVSVKRWRQAAINSLPMRAVKSAEADNQHGKAIDRNASQKTIDKYGKRSADAKDRLDHAKEVATTMKDSKRPAKKVMRAAELASYDREDKVDPDEMRKYAREAHADILSNYKKVKDFIREFNK